jgi:hypothetical protein
VRLSAGGERPSPRCKRGEVVIKDRQRPFARGVPGSGKELEAQPPRQGPGRQDPAAGDSFWIIAEHGSRAGWVRNIQHNPRVRVRLRIGLRYRWVPGIATIRPDEDALARQRKVIAWHPLRALNAVNVRVLGADLLAVHVKLQLDGAPTGETAPPAGTTAAQQGTPALAYTRN